MSNRKFTFLHNIFWLHYGINVFHFQNRWQMIIFYMVLRQNEFSFIVKQSTQPALFLLDAHRKLLPFIKLSWILLFYTLTVLQVTSIQGDSQDNQCWCWWRHVVPAVIFQIWVLVVGKGSLLRHQLITFGAEIGREKVSLHSFSLAGEHVWLAKMLAKSLDFNEIWGHRR